MHLQHPLAPSSDVQRQKVLCNKASSRGRFIGQNRFCAISCSCTKQFCAISCYCTKWVLCNKHILSIEMHNIMVFDNDQNLWEFCNNVCTFHCENVFMHSQIVLSHFQRFLFLLCIAFILKCFFYNFVTAEWYGWKLFLSIGWKVSSFLTPVLVKDNQTRQSYEKHWLKRLLDLRSVLVKGERG